jgi:integrase
VRWSLRFESKDGRMCSRRFPTKKAAEEFAATVEPSRAAGVDPGKRTTLREGAEAWEASHLAHGLRSSSVKDYRQSLRRLRSLLGDARAIRDLTPVDLERARNELVAVVKAERSAKLSLVLMRLKKAKVPTDANLATLAREEELLAEVERGGVRAAAKMIGCARTLWKFFCSRGYAARNIAADVKKPRASKAVSTGVIDSNILSPSEIAKLVASAHDEDRCVIRFLFLTGVRFGELLGFQWNDFEFAKRRVIVRRQRSGLTGELTEPKTKAGTRWIDLPADLVTELKAHRLRTPGEFVFPVDERNFRSRIWAPTLRRAGLRHVRIHDARHTSASLLIGSGADVVAVSRRLGHSNPAVTLSVYSHAFARRDSAPLGEALAAFIAREANGG